MPWPNYQISTIKFFLNAKIPMSIEVQNYLDHIDKLSTQANKLNSVLEKLKKDDKKPIYAAATTMAIEVITKEIAECKSKIDKIVLPLKSAIIRENKAQIPVMLGASVFHKPGVIKEDNCRSSSVNLHCSKML